MRKKIAVQKETSVATWNLSAQKIENGKSSVAFTFGSLSISLAVCVLVRVNIAMAFVVVFFSVLCAFFNIYNVYCGIGPIAFKHIALGALLKVARAQFPIVFFIHFVVYLELNWKREKERYKDRAKKVSLCERNCILFLRFLLYSLCLSACLSSNNSFLNICNRKKLHEAG